ncbi:MAG: single-stranded-DNA-specific exonuclease [Rubritalea sp.]|jgi:single-stranded-DNA-specific exonuclease
MSKTTETEVKWMLKAAPDSAIADHAGVPAILLHLLAQRGVQDPDDVDFFLNPKLQDLSDPYDLPNMQAAVERIFRAVDANERILVYGDYDVDGVTSVTLMLRILSAYGLEASFFIPKRGEEGYGLSELAIERMLEIEKNIPEKGGVDLVITVDCGTASLAEIEILNNKGIDVIVVDHHEMSEAGTPDCIAVVNPKLGEDHHYLCAAGVVFKLTHALLKERMLEDFDLKECLDLVAVATISDIVPLVDENRLLVRHGLKRLPLTSNHGLKALQDIADLKGKLTSMDVGFRIGPRLNAAGRMDQPDEALNLLMADNVSEAKALGAKLNDFNIERQQLEKRIREEAMTMLLEKFDPVNDPVIVLGSRDWHPGVVGIVASRLMRMYYKPTFIIAIDEHGVGKGSGRSVEGISLVGAIRACDEHLITGGGHDMAAGLSIDEDQLNAFREGFGRYVLENTSLSERTPRIYVDAEISFEQLSLKFLDSYELLQPFGSKNPQPLFMSKEVWLTEAPRRLKNQHLKLFMRQGVVEHDAIFFGGGERDLPDPPWDVAFTIDRNTFRGVTSLQVVIQDIRAAQ